MLEVPIALRADEQLLNAFENPHQAFATAYTPSMVEQRQWTSVLRLKGTTRMNSQDCWNVLERWDEIGDAET